MKVIFLQIFGLSFTVLGGLMFLGTLMNIPMISEDLTKWLLMLFVLSLAPIGIGFWLMRKAKAISIDKKYREYEALVIALAQNKSKTITVADVAVHTSLTFKEAEDFLHQMYLSGLFEMDTSGDGQITYTLRS